MPRGVTPIRVRRRQSDAKWRASVAMCYNIMKSVIANHKKQGRKKLSKALTLKETERHIVSLEKKLRELIEDRAPQSGKVVMVEKEGGRLFPATFEDVKQDYALKQIAFFAGGSGSTGKKRYNVPLDIESSLESLSQQSCRLLTINGGEIEATFPQLYRRTHRENAQTMTDSSARLANQLTVPLRDFGGENLLTEPLHDIDGDNGDLHPTVAKQQNTPCKTRHQNARHKVRRAILQDTPKTVETTKTPKAPENDRKALSLKTPSKARKQLPFGTITTPGKVCHTRKPATGFTPVKLPYGLDNSDPVMGMPVTPVMSLLGSPLNCFTMPETPGSSCFQGVESFDFTDDDEGASLLCTESIDSMDLEMPFASLPVYEKENPLDTSQNNPKLKTMSTRVYGDDDQEVPDSDKSCLDFDGYLLFYQHNVGSVHPDWSSSQTANTIAQMWETMCPEERAVYSHMAAHDIGEESHDLSDDLVSIDLKPLHKDNHADDMDYVSEAQYHKVPNLSLDLSSNELNPSPEFNLVPGYEDLGVFYIDSQDKQGYLEDEEHYSVDRHDCSQVVPEM